MHSYLWNRDRVKFNPFSRKRFNRTPYIIRRHASDVGLLSYFNTILGGIAYADKHGYIPVVDMKNYPNTYLHDDEVGRINSWEYYFAQPGGLSLDDALSSRKYILSRDTALHAWPRGIPENFYNQNGELDYWRELCRKYIRFTEPVLDGLEQMKKKYAGKRILGVKVRGTDYAAMRPKHHTIPPTAEQAIAKTKEVMQKEGFDFVYLATEDKRILMKFQEAFGKELLLPTSHYVDYDYDNAVSVSTYITSDKYIHGLEYIVSTLFLAQCEGLIAMICNGSLSAAIFSEGFEYIYVFDLGVWP